MRYFVLRSNISWGIYFSFFSLLWTEALATVLFHAVLLKIFVWQEAMADTDHVSLEEKIKIKAILFTFSGKDVEFLNPACFSWEAVLPELLSLQVAPLACDESKGAGETSVSCCLLCHSIFLVQGVSNLLLTSAKMWQILSSKVGEIWELCYSELKYGMHP